MFYLTKSNFNFLVLPLVPSKNSYWLGIYMELESYSSEMDYHRTKLILYLFLVKSVPHIILPPLAWGLICGPDPKFSYFVPMHRYVSPVLLDLLLIFPVFSWFLIPYMLFLEAIVDLFLSWTCQYLIR